LLVAVAIVATGWNTAQAATPRPTPLTASAPEGAPGDTGIPEVPSFLVTAKTKQVYRVHLSGLHASDALMAARGAWPIIARLPAANPLRRALQSQDPASLVDDYRTMRSIFLAAGADTLYLVAEADWLTVPELQGYLAFRGTVVSRNRLVERLKAAGYPNLCEFVGGFQPATGARGWLVRSQGNIGAPRMSQKKTALVKHALTRALPVKPASLFAGPTRGSYAVVNLQATWPITVVNLEPNQVDRILGPVIALFIPQAGQMTQMLQEAESVTSVVSMAPMPML
jgi:hypothetical protein